ncbi:hypothetical protein LTR10_009474 [Elasticomyces elasticus]|nr:hypothetical protein LTR10_009474 [Elasticomyces elasticus]
MWNTARQTPHADDLRSLGVHRCYALGWILSPGSRFTAYAMLTASHMMTEPRPATLSALTSSHDEAGPLPPDTLQIYLRFLSSRKALMEYKERARPPKRIVEEVEDTAEEITTNMAAIFDADDPSSPLHYSASQTALLLLDYQGFIVSQLGEPGAAAVATAVGMRDWALNHGITVVHSLVDVKSAPPPTCKGANRISAMLAGLKDDPAGGAEVPSLAFSQHASEYVVLKSPGVVSALQSKGVMELLAEQEIKSLVICGLSTSGAVMRTAVPATDEGFVVSVVSDACADRKEGVHTMVLETLLPNRVHVMSADEFVGEWSRAKGLGKGKEAKKA